MQNKHQNKHDMAQAFQSGGGITACRVCGEKTQVSPTYHGNFVKCRICLVQTEPTNRAGGRSMQRETDQDRMIRLYSEISEQERAPWNLAYVDTATSTATNTATATNTTETTNAKSKPKRKTNKIPSEPRFPGWITSAIYGKVPEKEDPIPI